MTKYAVLPLALFLCSCEMLQKNEENMNKVTYSDNDSIKYESSSYERTPEIEHISNADGDVRIVDESKTRTVAEVFAEDIAAEEAAVTEDAVEAQDDAVAVAEDTTEAQDETAEAIEGAVEAQDETAAVAEVVEKEEVVVAAVAVEASAPKVVITEDPIKYESTVDEITDERKKDTFVKDESVAYEASYIKPDENKTPEMERVKLMDPRLELEHNQETVARLNAEEAARILAAEEAAAEAARALAAEEADHTFHYYKSEGIYYKPSTKTYYWKHSKYLIDGKKLPSFLDASGPYKKLRLPETTPDAHWKKVYAEYLENLPSIK